MTNDSEHETGGETRISGIVSANLQRILDERGWQQSDLIMVIRDLGLLNWELITASRTLSGERKVTLEEAIVLAGVFAVPLTELMQGEALVGLSGGGMPVTLEHLRDIVTTGGRLGGSSTDPPSAFTSAWFRDGFPSGSSPLDVRLGNQIGASVAEVATAADELWSAPAHDELERRVHESLERLSSADPMRQMSSTNDSAATERRRRRALQGHHVSAMAKELAEHGVGQ